MKRILWLLMLLFLLTGCGLLSRSTAPEPTPLPSAALSPGQTAIESSPTPTKRASEQLYQNDALHLSLRYPSGWQFVDGDRVSGEKFAGADGYFRTGAMSGGGMTLEEVAQSEAQHVLKPFGSNPVVETLQVHGQEARLILPSTDQPKTAVNEPAWGELLVRYPRPVLVNHSLVEFFVLYGDVNHIRDLATTITFGDPPGVFSADSDTPAAGICADISGSLVTLTISSDVPSPRCAKIAPSQVISFINMTGSSVTLTLAWYTIPLGPSETFTFDAPVGAFLAPGVHIPTIQGGGNAPELWLANSESGNTILTTPTPGTSPSTVAGSDPTFIQPGEVISIENVSRLRELTTWDSTAVKSVQFIPGLDKVALDLEDQVILYAPQDPQTIERLPLPVPISPG